MTRRKTPGKRLVESLSEMLDEGDEWTEQETVTLALIAAATDRIEVLRRLFDIEVATLRPGGPGSEPAVSTRRVTEVASELRQCEANVVKWVATLRPNADAVQQKSRQHVDAANTRWHGGVHQDGGPGGTTPTLTIVH